MHIGLIGSRGPDSFSVNIGDALGRMGHRVTSLGATYVTRGPQVTGKLARHAISLVPDLEAPLHRRLARIALERECDAVISTDGNLVPDAVALLRRSRVPVALWFPDAVCNLGRARMFLAPYSALFFKEPVLVERLRDLLDPPVWYLPQACNPRWHRPIGRPGATRAIAVVGNLYPSRIVLLRRLHAAGIPLVLYGAPAPRWSRAALPQGVHAGYPVFGESKAQVFRGAAAVLNNLHPAEIHGVNLRLFEATAAGAAVLSERRPVLGELFELDTEVVPFGTFDELVARARDLLADDQLVRKVGDAASRRAHRDHTYEQRLPAILEKLA